MSKQSEAILENQLVAQLQKMGYKSASIKTEQDLINNLKVQLEKHNKIIFSDKEFNEFLDKQIVASKFWNDFFLNPESYSDARKFFKKFNFTLLF